MKALVLTAPNTIEVKSVDKPALNPGQALVKIKAAALNHRDQWCREGKYPNITYGVTLGSDGSGVVADVAEASYSDWLEKEVVINPSINWGDNPDAQAAQFKILGMPDNGTFAEYIAVDIDRLHLKPSHLSFAEAAALPLGGLTAYRAVFTKGEVTSKKNVLISGIGGGVAQLAFLFARVAGANVYVTSGSLQKIQQAVEKGALDGFNYKEQEWFKAALEKTGGFDVVVDSAGGDQINTLIKVLKPGGKLVIYGATAGLPSSLNLRQLFWNQITIHGTTMGNDEEFQAMLDYVSENKIHPIVDSVRPFDEIVSAFDEMHSGKQSGKLVVEL